MTLEDQFKYFVSAYYGIIEMDDYDLKVYILKDIENHIKNFLAINPIPNYDYRKEAEKIKDEESLKSKLQDALSFLNKIDGPLDLKIMLKERIHKMSK